MSINSITDERLIRLYIRGEESSLNILINRYRTRISGFILSKVRNVDIAEDIFQETFIKVIKTLRVGKYNEQGKFLPWVMRIAYNLCIDHFRSIKKQKFVRSRDDFDVFNLIKDTSVSEEDKLIQKKILDDVKLLIDRLPDAQKQVLKMRYYADMSFHEISESCNISINTALGRMRYAILNLRKFIQKEGLVLSVN
jgi:RNA polymerase sigma-70 factor (ECF subfamily)